jgi:hypothetical protein
MEMASSHRPDFEALEREGDVDSSGCSRYRDCYLWPYINEEDLCNSRSLLLLMSTRSRCHPSELAYSEGEAHRLGTCAFAFGTVSTEWQNCVIDLTSQAADGSYGRLWDRRTDPDRFAALDTQAHQSAFNGL